MDDKTTQAILAAMAEGLCGNETDFRIRLKYGHGITVSTKQVRSILDKLYSEGRIQARRFGNGTDISWYIEE